MKYSGNLSIAVTDSRRLHGRRGLKLRLRRELLALSKSPPSRAAWIEMLFGWVVKKIKLVAAFTGGVD